MVKPRKGSQGGSSSSISNKSSLNSKTKSPSGTKNFLKKEPTIKEENVADDNDDWNSGFGQYIRSAEGSHMLVLFVLANTFVLILTTAWPQFKLLYSLIKESLFGEEEEEE